MDVTKRVNNIRLEPLKHAQSLRNAFNPVNNFECVKPSDSFSDTRRKQTFETVVWVRSYFPQQSPSILDPKIAIRALIKDLPARQHKTPETTKIETTSQTRVRIARGLTKSSIAYSSDSISQERTPSSLTEINSVLSISPWTKELKQMGNATCKAFYDPNTASGSDTTTPTTQSSDQSRAQSKGVSFSQCVSNTSISSQTALTLKESGRRVLAKNFICASSNKISDQPDRQKSNENVDVPQFMNEKLTSSNKENIMPLRSANNLVPPTKPSADIKAAELITKKDNVASSSEGTSCSKSSFKKMICQLTKLLTRKGSAKSLSEKLGSL